MNRVKCSQDSFKSIPDYENVVKLLYLNENDADLMHKCGFLKSDIIRLCLAFKKQIIGKK